MRYSLLLTICLIMLSCRPAGDSTFVKLQYDLFDHDLDESLVLVISTTSCDGCVKEAIRFARENRENDLNVLVSSDNQKHLKVFKAENFSGYEKIAVTNDNTIQELGLDIRWPVAIQFRDKAVFKLYVLNPQNMKSHFQELSGLLNNI